MLNSIYVVTAGDTANPTFCDETWAFLLILCTYLHEYDKGRVVGGNVK